MPLQGFTTLDICTAASVLPGAGKLEYAPIAEVDTAAFNDAIQQSDYNQQAPAGVSTWYALPYSSGTGTWQESQDNTEQGDIYRLNVSVFLAADTPQVRGELNAMRHHRFLIRLQRNGRTFLLGTPENPLRMLSTFESGAEAGESRGHRVQFTGQSTRKSPAYVPVF